LGCDPVFCLRPLGDPGDYPGLFRCAGGYPGDKVEGYGIQQEPQGVNHVPVCSRPNTIHYFAFQIRICYNEGIKKQPVKIANVSGYQSRRKQMQKIWVNKADSFSDAEQFDQSYYSEMLPSDKLDTMQWLREEYFRSRKMGISNESGKRLRRVFKIIKQT